MMRRPAFFAAVAVLLAAPSFGGSPSVNPIEIPAGSVVDFQLQSRLSPSAIDATDALPAGTTLRVKLLDEINSQVKGDGSTFQGVLVSPLEQNNHVVVSANAEAHGLLALLRSQRHPEGFRYELLVTNLVDGDKSYVVTASLGSSLFEQKNSAPDHASAQNSAATNSASN